MPRVTVYIPAFQHERHVGEAIESVLAQDFSDFELIICDDASTDGTWDAISQFRDPRIITMRNSTNLGASATARRCLAAGSGEFIAPMSSDDVWLPEKLGRQVALMDDKPEVIAAFSTPGFIDENGLRLDPPPPLYTNFFETANRPRAAWREHFFRGNCGLFLLSALFRAETYHRTGGFDPRLAQLPDFDLFVRLAELGEFWIDEAHLVDFRIHSGGENVSAPEPEKIPRLNREWVHLMRHFLRPGVDPLDLAESAWEIGTRPHRWFALDVALSIDPDSLNDGSQTRLAQFTRRALAAASEIWPGAHEEIAEATRVVEATRAEVVKLRASLEKARTKNAELREKLDRQSKTR